MTASDYVLAVGQEVVAYGLVEVDQDGSRLWVLPAWDRSKPRRIGDGVVALTGLPPDPTAEDQAVRVTGIWTGEGITAHTVEPLDAIPPPWLIPAVEGSEATVDSLTEGEVLTAFGQASEHADGLAFASGGGTGYMEVQVVHVAARLAAWHEQSGRQYVRLAISVVPALMGARR